MWYVYCMGGGIRHGAKIVACAGAYKYYTRSLQCSYMYVYYYYGIYYNMYICTYQWHCLILLLYKL